MKLISPLFIAQRNQRHHEHLGAVVGEELIAGGVVLAVRADALRTYVSGASFVGRRRHRHSCTCKREYKTVSYLRKSVVSAVAEVWQL